MQDAVYALICLSAAIFAAQFVSKEIRRLNEVKKTKSWPAVEATVQSARVEAVRHMRFGEIQLPVFELSYLVREKPYAERFALSMCSEPIDTVMTKMVGRKVTVHYDPANPGACFVLGETIEGCRIEQTIGSLIRFYPRS